MMSKDHIPLLEPRFFRDTFIENLQKDLLNNAFINDFFIHSFQEDVVELKLPLPPHKKTVNDFVFILKGEMTKSVGLNTFELKANDFLFTPANQITTTTRADRQLEGFYGHFSDRFLIDYPNLKFWYTDAATLPVLTVSPAQAKSLVILLNRMLVLYRNSVQNKSAFQLIRFYLSTFIAELSVIFQENISSHQAHPVWYRFNELVNQNFKTSRQVSYYAQLLHLSPNHLNKVVKSETGKSASEIIHHKCVLEAKVLLVQTSLDISEIAEELGFDDVSYFSRFFKRWAGVTPGKYRKMIDLS